MSYVYFEKMPRSWEFTHNWLLPKFSDANFSEENFPNCLVIRRLLCIICKFVLQNFAFQSIRKWHHFGILENIFQATLQPFGSLLPTFLHPMQTKKVQKKIRLMDFFYFFEMIHHLCYTGGLFLYCNGLKKYKLI